MTHIFMLEIIVFIDCFQTKTEDSEEEDNVLQPLLDLQKTADEKQALSQIQLFSQSQFISSNGTDDDDIKEEDTEDIAVE